MLIEGDLDVLTRFLYLFCQLGFYPADITIRKGYIVIAYEGEMVCTVETLPDGRLDIYG